MNYYNEIDPYAAAWLRMLIELKLIPAGEVDERSITDVSPNELSGFTQCHFFAGIGGWSLALRLAGVPDDAEVDTGSCPCPPFSSAGKKKLCPECGGKPIPHPLKTGIFACVPCGHEWFADERHLYPELLRIITKRRPPVFFGEQVVGADGLVWLTGVRATLEAVGYAFGASDLCSAGVSSPNIRQRLYWVADSECARRETSGMRPQIDPRRKSQSRCSPCRLGDTHDSRPQGHDRNGDDGNQPRRHGPEPVGPVGETSGFGGLADDNSDRCNQGRASESSTGYDGPFGNGFWSDSTAILCRDSKHRRISTEPALFPLADGIPYKLARRGSIRPALLKGAGNAINPHVAAEFIRAFFKTK